MMVNHIRNLTIGLILIVSLSSCNFFGTSGNASSNCEDDFLGVRMTPPEGVTVVSERCRMGFNAQASMELTFPPSLLDAVVESSRVVEVHDTIPDGTNIDLLPVDPNQFDSFLVGMYSDGAYL
ncbi:MAG: hypothetical protein KC546_15185, partial [Anaerolineae bacterium]|nr:hypothetical protein [Anaerolineae bacterium]